MNNVCYNWVRLGLNQGRVIISTALAALALTTPAVAIADNDDTALRITNKGNVGIGTEKPGGLLGLKEDDVYLDVDGNKNLTFTDGHNDGVTLTKLNQNSWQEGDGEDIYYDGNGSVGIGTSMPSSNAKLDVDGQIRTKSLTFHDGSTQNTAADNFPSQTVIFMLSDTCPDGWSIISDDYMGRFVVITPKSGETPWTNDADPLKDKNPPTHTHNIYTSKHYEYDGDSGSRTASNTSVSDENNEDLPYLQLHACVKK
jgi:hypothetical protein